MLRYLVIVCAMVTLPVVALAQEASISGTVTDATGGVLPGVVVRAVHEASGNSFEAVTDATGVFRLPVRIGVYRIAAELAGFAPVTRTGLQVLVGQQAVGKFQMTPAALQGAGGVPGESPLPQTTGSTGGRN